MAVGSKKGKGEDWEDSLDTLWLWLRVVIAVVVALGVAVKEGPGAVVTAGDGEEEGIDHVREEERERALRRLEAREGRGLGLEGWCDE